MKTLKTNLFDMATIRNDQLKEEFENRINVRAKPKYRERQVAIKERNVLVCEIVDYQKKENAYPFHEEKKRNYIMELNKTFLRDNPYFNQKEKENWEVLLDAWEKKECDVKAKDMYDLNVLIDEKEKAERALQYNVTRKNYWKVRSIKNHIAYLDYRMRRATVNEVVTKNGSGKYYTKRSYNTGFQKKTIYNLFQSWYD